MPRTYTYYISDTRPTDAGQRNGQDAVDVTAGKFRCVKIPFQPEGGIYKVSVKQVGGSAVAAKVDLLISEVPYPEGEYANGSNPVSPLCHYRIIPQLSVTSGQELEYYQNPPANYKNADGTPTNPSRYLYLVIYPTAAGGETTWDVSLHAETDIGGP